MESILTGKAGSGIGENGADSFNFIQLFYILFYNVRKTIFRSSLILP